MKTIRSCSFDTSFLLKEDKKIDKIIKKLNRDVVSCYITATVLSELEHLKVFDRIDVGRYNRALSRWTRTNGSIIDFKNQLLSSSIGRACIDSMETHHGVNEKDIINDCRILVTALKNGVDLFLSEDFHFTSKVSLISTL